ADLARSPKIPSDPVEPRRAPSDPAALANTDAPAAPDVLTSRTLEPLMTDLSPVTRRTLLLGTGTVAALTLAACGGGSGSGASDAGGGGGDEEIIIGSTNEPTGLQRNVGGSSGISETMSRKDRKSTRLNSSHV